MVAEEVMAVVQEMAEGDVDVVVMAVVMEVAGPVVVAHQVTVVDQMILFLSSHFRVNQHLLEM
jgi:N-acetyl-gamma-glutamylphosphate reductase